MKNFDGNYFKFAGKKYFFNILISSNNDKQIDQNFTVSLLNENIKSCEIISELNNLLLTGNFIVLDPFGELDKYISSQYVFCKISFIEIKEQKDGAVTTQKLSETQKFEHLFFVNNIEILERQTSSISYKFSIISNFVWNCISYISYTNYNKQPESIFEIIKNCIGKISLKIDEKKFENIKTNVKINYITNGNDNLCSIVKFLLNRLYYFQNLKDDSLKFIYYDFSKNWFSLFDIKDLNTVTGKYNLILSMFKTSSENMLNDGQPLNFATVTKYSMVEMISNFIDINYINYNYEKNEIKKEEIKSKQIIKYLNNHFENDNFINKYVGLQSTDIKYKKNILTWNNNLDLYTKNVKFLKNVNSIIVNCNGEILRQPTSLVNLNIDRNIESLDSLKKEELDELKLKYKEFDGPWFVSKVRNLIFPSISLYKQNLVLIRNFKTKPIK